MRRNDFTLRAILLAIAILLGVIALRPLFNPGASVLAQSARFDHVYIVSPAFLYKGEQGLLVLDRRNANVWFIPRAGDPKSGAAFGDPVFITRLPFEKLDQASQ